MFHGFYNQSPYLPRVFTCAENDLVVMMSLLFGTAHPALGIDDDLEYLEGRLKAVWPDVEIPIRADSGFAFPTTYAVSEWLDLFDTIGLRMNPVLKRASEPLLSEAIETYEEQAQPQRLFQGFWNRAGSWLHERSVVTNRPGGHDPAGCLLR